MPCPSDLGEPMKIVVGAAMKAHQAARQQIKADVGGFGDLRMEAA